MKKNRKNVGFKAPAYKKKVGRLLAEKNFKFIGNNPKSLKLQLNLMPNFKVLLL